jgi:tetraacyldisaccharide 4'-kinase
MHTEASVSRRVARVLERSGASFAPFGVRSLVKRIDLPSNARVIGVGGATIGGSGKTPLAIAIVRALVERGERAVFVAHGHRGRVDRARVVQTDDDPRIVGDESIVAARRLENVAPVIVGRNRGESIAFAATFGDTLVVDHLHQTRPRPLDRAVLAIDRHRPWGSGRTFPFGDLVATPDTLASIADVVVRIGGDEAMHVLRIPPLGGRIGLVTSVARPDRIVRSLEDLGASPVIHVERADHAAGTRRDHARLTDLARRHRLEAWRADDKSAVLLGPHAGVPIVALEHRLALDSSVVDRLARSC